MAKGQLSTQRIDFAGGRVQQAPFALGHGLIPQLHFQIEFRFRQGGALLIHRDPIIARIDLQQGGIFVKGFPDHQTGIEFHHPAADFRFHDQPLMHLHGPVRDDHGLLVPGPRGQDFDKGRFDASRGFGHGRTNKHQPLRRQEGQPDDEKGQDHLQNLRLFAGSGRHFESSRMARSSDTGSGTHPPPRDLYNCTTVRR